MSFRIAGQYCADISQSIINTLARWCKTQCMLQQQELNRFLCTIQVGHSSGLFANNKESEFLPGVLFSNYLQVTFRPRTRLGNFYQKFFLIMSALRVT